VSLVRRRRLRSSNDGVRSKYLDESFYMLKTQSVPVTNAVSMVEHFTWYAPEFSIITRSQVHPSGWLSPRLSPRCDVFTWSRVVQVCAVWMAADTQGRLPGKTSTHLPTYAHTPVPVTVL
jgi:hypothetical protein